MLITITLLSFHSIGASSSIWMTCQMRTSWSWIYPRGYRSSTSWTKKLWSLSCQCSSWETRKRVSPLPYNLFLLRSGSFFSFLFSNRFGRAQAIAINILCLVLFDPIKIFCLPYMKSTSDEEVEKLLEAISRRISIFVLVESAGRDQNKNRDESKSFQKFFNFRIH